MRQEVGRHHVVIIGGGFGGLKAAKALQRGPVRVTLVDKRNFHLFQPLLYQVATGGLSPGDITYPLRAAVAGAKNIEVLAAEVVDILPDGTCSDEPFAIFAAKRARSTRGRRSSALFWKD